MPESSVSFTFIYILYFYLCKLSVAETKCGRFARKSIRPKAFARILVDSPDDILTLYKKVKIPYSYPWIPHVQSLSFHAYSLFSGLKNDKYALGEST